MSQDTPASDDVGDSKESTSLNTTAPPGAAAEKAPTGLFTDFDLHPTVLAALSKLEIVHPTPIQLKVLAPILAGKDVIGKAETGTGKTIGFGAPLIGKIDTNRVAVQALVLTPTRELALQVATVLEQLSEGLNIKVAIVVGGVHASEQILRLREGSQIVVATPGRLLDFLKDRTLSLVWCETVVIDEADRLFDMGFIDDVRSIVEHTPKERQTLLFSATVPKAVENLMKRYMKSPEIHSTSTGLSTVSEIRQAFRPVAFPDKFRELCAILDERQGETTIVFCNTRHQAIDLDRMLFGHEYPARSLHGDHEQEMRFKILEAFRSGETKILVATDVASRGLDVDNVGKVINFEVPIDTESYVHRIGRTGRASKEGLAITLVAPKEQQQWNRIVKSTRFTIEREEPKAVEAVTGSRGSENRGRGRNADRQTSSSQDSRQRSGRGRSRRRRGRRSSKESAGSETQNPTTNQLKASAPEASPASAPAGNATTGDQQQSEPSGAPKARAAQDQATGGSESTPTSRRGGRSRRRRPKSRSADDSGKREEGLFENPLKRPGDAQPVGPVSADVDLFGMSMRDFLDDNLEMKDFTSDLRRRDPAIDLESASSGKDKADESASGQTGDRETRRKRRRPARRRSRSSGGGGAATGGQKQEPAASSDPRKPSSGAASSGAGSTSSSERPARRRRRRRRKPKEKE